MRGEAGTQQPFPSQCFGPLGPGELAASEAVKEVTVCVAIRAQVLGPACWVVSPALPRLAE